MTDTYIGAYNEAMEAIRQKHKPKKKKVDNDSASASNNFSMPQNLFANPKQVPANFDLRIPASDFDLKIPVSNFDPSTIKNIRGNNVLKNLQPELATRAIFLYQECKKAGIDIKFTSGFRSGEEQDKLYAQGRSSKGSRVTNAAAGDSFHNYGLAFDVTPVKGQSEATWAKIGAIGKQLGLTWGGDFKSIYDPCHFQLGSSITQVKQQYKTQFNKYA